MTELLENPEQKKGLCPHGNFPSSCETCAKFADGNITEAELEAHWKNTDNPLFVQEITRTRKDQPEVKTNFAVRGLTEKGIDPLLKNLKSAWEEVDFQSLSDTLASYRGQINQSPKPLLNVEYYTATDTKNNKAFAMTGLYTVDLEGGAGFATQKALDRSKHYLATGLGWFSVAKEYQGTGVGGFFLDWTEKMAKGRGADFMFIETDTGSNEERAVDMYERKGYKMGFQTPDYFGPGRDLATYHTDISKETNFTDRPDEEIGNSNKQEVLELAMLTYSPERLKELEAVLDLLVNQPKNAEAIYKPSTFILRDPQGKPESFGIMATGVYDNAVYNYWYGSIRGEKETARMGDAIKSVAKSLDKDVIITTREGEDASLESIGFQKTTDKGIPGVYEKGDDTRFLFYTKKLK